MFPTINHEHKRVLWCSHKCGSTAIRSKYYKYVVGAKKHKASGNRLIYTSTLGLKERIVNNKYFSNYRNVLVVRNPYNRIPSLYFDKFFSGMDLHAKLYKARGFDNFLHDLHEQWINKNFVGIDIRHSEPQFINNYASGLNYNVYRLEDQMEEMFKKEFAVNIQNTSEKFINYKHLYNEQNKKLLRLIYKLDFDELEKIGIYYEI